VIFKEIEFRITDNFLNKYKRKQPNWGPLGLFTYKRTYARPLSKNKTEEWWQTVQRVVEGCYLIQKRHCSYWKLPWNERVSQNSAQAMYDLIFNFKFLPPGRGLWAMGTDFMFERGGACLNNCGFVSTDEISIDFSAPFVWLMDMSMMGVGVGFDTTGADGKEVYLRSPRISKDTHIINDSREGWTVAFQRVLDAYSGRDSLPERWDFSEIRPAGVPIKGFGGIAPGPKPLEVLLDRTAGTLNRYVVDDKPVDSTLIVDLMNFAGAAVVAGGIRRSSEIAFGRLNDEEFINLKSQKNIEDSSLARWASNNSIVASLGMDYSIAETHSAVNGEPGFFWLDNARAYGRLSDGRTNKDHRVAGCNPCGEQSLESFELCNLVETFPSRHESLDEYLKTLKYAYLYAKSVTLVATNDPRTNAVMFRNRRIGVSQTGITENINKIGFREHIQWCEDGYQKIKEFDTKYSDWLCIPKSIKRTTVKPSGTVSLLPGVTPGIHFPHAEYYIRRVRVNNNSSLIGIMSDAGYNVEADKAVANTSVIEFPVHEPNFDRGKDSISVWEQFELAAAMQAKWADNQVSITITVRPEEAQDLPRALSMYEKRLKSVSFLPLRGDKIYKQPPYEAINAKCYKKMQAKIKPIKLHLDEEDRIPERFCDSDVCTLQ
jgi:adenosylcobalamin-dependent ribonucleoside-triphosphate reductase